MTTATAITLGQVHDASGIDEDLVHESEHLRSRAAALRLHAVRGLRGGQAADEVLAATYRRRASELELEAWAREVRSGVPYEQVHPAA